MRFWTGEVEEDFLRARRGFIDLGMLVCILGIDVVGSQPCPLGVVVVVLLSVGPGG